MNAIAAHAALPWLEVALFVPAAVVVAAAVLRPHLRRRGRSARIKENT